MTSKSLVITVINWLMTLMFIVSFCYIGVWCLYSPDDYLGFLGAEITFIRGFARSEMRQIGAWFILFGVFTIIATIKTAYLLDLYKLLAFIAGGMLLARFTEMLTKSTFESDFLVIAGIEVLMFVYAIARIRELGK